MNIVDSADDELGRSPGHSQLYGAHAPIDLCGFDSTRVAGSRSRRIPYGVPIARIELIPQLQIRGFDIGVTQYVKFGPDVNLVESRYWPIAAAGFLAEAGLGLLLTALTFKTRHWMFFVVWVNAACIGSGGDLGLLAAQLSVSPDYFRLISASLFLMGYILLIPWGLIAMRQRKRRIQEEAKKSPSAELA